MSIPITPYCYPSLLIAYSPFSCCTTQFHSQSNLHFLFKCQSSLKPWLLSNWFLRKYHFHSPSNLPLKIPISSANANILLQMPNPIPSSSPTTSQYSSSTSITLDISIYGNHGSQATIAPYSPNGEWIAPANVFDTVTILGLIIIIPWKRNLKFLLEWIDDL